MAKLISAIHVAKARFGMDDATYQDFLRGVTGKTSCAQMTQRGTVNQCQTVIESMKRWKARVAAQELTVAVQNSDQMVCDTLQ